MERLYSREAGQTTEVSLPGGTWCRAMPRGWVRMESDVTISASVMGNGQATLGQTGSGFYGNENPQSPPGSFLARGKTVLTTRSSRGASKWMTIMYEACHVYGHKRDHYSRSRPGRETNT